MADTNPVAKPPTNAQGLTAQQMSEYAGASAQTKNPALTPQQFLASTGQSPAGTTVTSTQQGTLVSTPQGGGQSQQTYQRSAASVQAEQAYKNVMDNAGDVAPQGTAYDPSVDAFVDPLTRAMYKGSATGQLNAAGEEVLDAAPQRGPDSNMGGMRFTFDPAQALKWNDLAYMSPDQTAAIANMSKPVDPGVVTSDNAVKGADAIKQTIDASNANPLPHADYNAQNTPRAGEGGNYTPVQQAVIDNAIQELNRLKSIQSDPTLDPSYKMLLDLNNRLETQRKAEVESIHAKAANLIEERKKANEIIEGKTRAFAAGTGFSSATSTQMLALMKDTIDSNQDALSSIAQAEKDSIRKANDAYDNNELQNAAKMVELAQSYRKDYSSLLQTTANLQNSFDDMAMKKAQFNMDMQTKAVDLKVKNAELAGKLTDARNLELSNLAKAGFTYNSATADYFDSWERQYGMPPGYVQGYLDRYQKTQDATDLKTQAEAAASLANIPYGQTIKIGDTTYHGTKMGTVEIDSKGVGTMVYVDPADGKLKTMDLGKIGKATTTAPTIMSVNGKDMIWDADLQTFKPLPSPTGLSNTLNGLIKNGTYTGQCGESMHLIATDYPYNLNTVEQKRAAVTTKAPIAGGSVVFTDESAKGSNTGHVAFVTGVDVDANGRTVLTLSESNYKLDGKWDNTRTIFADDPHIMGYRPVTLKPEYQAGSDVPLEKPTPTNTEPPTDDRTIKVKSDSPFLTGIMTQTQKVAGQQKEDSAIVAAQNLLDGTTTDIKDIEASVRQRALALAKENGWNPTDPKFASADDLAVADSIANYHADITKVTSLRGDARTRIFALVAQRDPGFNMMEYESRQKFKNLWTSGKLGDSMQAANTASAHMGELKAISDELNNSWNPSWNNAKNWAKAQEGAGAPRSYMLAAQAVGDEMEKFFTSGGGTGAGREEWRASLNSNMSPKQIKSVLQTGVNLMAEQLTQMQNRYSKTMKMEPTEYVMDYETIDGLKSMGLDTSKVEALNRRVDIQNARNKVEPGNILVADGQGNLGQIPAGEYNPFFWKKL